MPKKTPIVLLLKKNRMVPTFLRYISRAGGGDRITVALEQTAIRDMLTDIMHLCKERKIIFTQRVIQAEEVFTEENILR